MQENTKSVVVKMTARRCFRTEPIWQYDGGHVLTFEGFELPAAFEVHFSRSPMGKAIPQIGTDGVCTVPEMFTQDAGVIYAWLYIADTDTRLTKYSIEIPVAKRAKPTNQEPTPVEQSAIDQAIAALNAGVERSETAADAAESAQEAAEGYAESAGNSAITATNAATAATSAQTAAETAARNAAASATDANASRQAADQSATNAGVSERNAAASASAAAGSATSAATSAGQASASATAASGSASTASTKASEAAQSATAAAGSAASASEDAGTASTAATAAGQSATAAAGSATAAAGSATSAGQSATAAAGSAQAAQDVLDSIPADYSELSGEVDTLLSAITEIESDLYDKGEQTVEHDDHIANDDLGFVAGWVTPAGAISGSDNFSRAYVDVKQGDTITYKTQSGTVRTLRFICAYEGETVNESKGAESVASYTVPADVTKVAVTIRNTDISSDNYLSIVYTTTDEVIIFSVPEKVREISQAPDTDIGKMLAIKTIEDGVVTEWEYKDASIELDSTLTQEGEAADAKATGDAIDALAEITTVSEETTQKSQVEPEFNIGFMGENGQIYTSGSYDNYRYTNKIPVLPGDAIYLYNGTGWETFSPRVITAFDGNTAMSASGAGSPQIPYVVPVGIDGIVITMHRDAISAAQIYIQRVVRQAVPILQGDVVALRNHTPDVGPNGITMVFDLTSGATYTDPDNRSLDDKYGYVVSFFGHISSLTGELWIIKGPADYGKTIIIDGTYIKYCNSTDTSTAILTTEHGLTIADYISITIDCGYDKNSVRVRTNGGEYLWEIGAYDPCNGALAVKSTNDAINDCVLSYNCYASKTDNWLYGDSYFSGWPKRLVQYGNHNNLINGHGGRVSIKALASFNLDLSFGWIPKRVIWCMGMNDKDGESAPTQAWMYAVSEVMRICDEKGVELILATIPNVPSGGTKNSEKNAYIRESGYRYIDFAKAVSPNDDATWYDGMLSQDNVHPTNEGSQALYSIAVATVPELLG